MSNLESRIPYAQMPVNTIRRWLNWSPPTASVYARCPTQQIVTDIADEVEKPQQKELAIRVTWGEHGRMRREVHGLFQALKSVQFEGCLPANTPPLSNTLCDMYGLPVINLFKSLILNPHDPKLKVLSAKHVLGSGSSLEVLHFFMEDDEADNPTWQEYGRRVDWEEQKASFLVVAFVRPHSLDITNIQPTSKFRSHTDTIEALELLQTLLEDTLTPFGILSDEVGSIVWDYRDQFEFQDFRLLPAELEVATVSECSIRCVIAVFLAKGLASVNMWTANFYRLPWRRPYQGALAETTLGLQTNGRYRQRFFSDFDMYTLQRCEEALEDFKTWAELIRDYAQRTQILPGARLTLKIRGIPATLRPHRSPYPSIQLPSDTTQVLNKFPRIRSTRLDHILMNTDNAQLEVIEVKRAIEDSYSQVFIVRVDGCDEPVCLKIYDERMFDLGEDLNRQNYLMTAETERLGHVVFSEDLAKREWGVYDRLQDLQGTLLPHCYGVHTVVLPDGWRCYCLLLEALPGCTLTKTNGYNLPRPAQESIASQIRQGYRALRLSFVCQEDWHGGQFMCIPPDEATGRGWQVVFIDFAFASLPLGEGGISFFKYCSVEAKNALFDYLPMDVVYKAWLPDCEEEIF